MDRLHYQTAEPNAAAKGRTRASSMGTSQVIDNIVSTSNCMIVIFHSLQLSFGLLCGHY